MSARGVRRRPAAQRDLIRHFVYLGEEAGLEMAERFVNAAEEAFEQVRKMPDMGVRCSFLNPTWKDLRRWQLPGFPKYLIFYRRRESNIEIVRVLHGAQDLGAIFE